MSDELTARFELASKEVTELSEAGQRRPAWLYALFKQPRPATAPVPAPDDGIHQTGQV